LAKNIYHEANIAVCVAESKLLKKFQYSLLHNAQSLQGVLDELNSINYFHSYRNASAHNFEKMLSGLMADTFDYIESIVPKSNVLQIFSAIYDIHNIKVAVKEVMLGKKLDNLFIEYGSYSIPTVRSAAVRKNDNILENKILTDGLFEAIRCGAIYDVDFILDRTYFRVLKSYGESLESSIISEFIVEYTDFYNLSAFFQAQVTENTAAQMSYFKKAFSECGSLTLDEWNEYAFTGKSGDLERCPLWQRYSRVLERLKGDGMISGDFDVIVDNYLIEKTKECKLIAFGIEPICAYFYNKLMEIKNIKILLAGKKYGFGTDKIKKRMRIPYEL